MCADIVHGVYPADIRADVVLGVGEPMSRACYFDRGSTCGALAGAKKCMGCKFFKTDVQFCFEAEQAEKRLKQKGLEKYCTNDDRISVRSIYKK